LFNLPTASSTEFTAAHDINFLEKQDRFANEWIKFNPIGLTFAFLAKKSSEWSGVEWSGVAPREQHMVTSEVSPNSASVRMVGISPWWVFVTAVLVGCNPETKRQRIYSGFLCVWFYLLCL